MIGPLALEAFELYRFFHSGGTETPALRGVSLEVYRGEVLAVTGPSGSGKSTLLACLAGLDEPDGGWVRIAGVAMTRRPEPERAALRARQVGVVFQAGNLVDHLSVEQNVIACQRLTGRRPDRRQVALLLQGAGLAGRAQATPSSLSGGEAARAGLAVALANHPAVVMADEPTGELDDTGARGVLRLLRSHADAGTAVVLVTHNPLVAEVADREVHLVDGRLVP
jgi:putative ABC transport system ATP-binding protein